MHIERQGNGPDLVLLHGWAMHGGIFAPFVEALAPRFRVHVVDLPGHGASRDEERFDLEDAVARIADRVPRAIWLGWSLGGLVALHAALDRPAQVRGLAMLCATPRFVAAPDWPHAMPAETLAQFGAGLRDDYRATIDRFLALETMGAPRAQAELRELRRHVFERGEPSMSALCDGLSVLGTTDLRAALPTLSMPSLWIGGRRDRLVFPAAMREAAARAPRAQYLEFNAAHAPFLDQPDALAERLSAFATGLAP